CVTRRGTPSGTPSLLSASASWWSSKMVSTTWAPSTRMGTARRTSTTPRGGGGCFSTTALRIASTTALQTSWCPTSPDRSRSPQSLATTTSSKRTAASSWKERRSSQERRG
ncbi:unnamed protein product, partial [Ectocarpus sp. 13 AM-2016]